MSLTHNGAALTASLEEQNVVSGDTLVLTLPTAGSQRSVRIELPASITPTFGLELSLAVGLSASDTIGQVKARVSGVTGVSTSRLSLTFGGTPLSTDGATLGGVGVADGGLLSLSISGSVSAPTYALRVALPMSMQAAFGE